MSFTLLTGAETFVGANATKALLEAGNSATEPGRRRADVGDIFATNPPGKNCQDGRRCQLR